MRETFIRHGWPKLNEAIAFSAIPREAPQHAAGIIDGEPKPHATMKAQDARKEKKKAPLKTAKEKKLAKAEKKKVKW